jgi:hypothetical protein
MSNDNVGIGAAIVAGAFGFQLLVVWILAKWSKWRDRCRRCTCSHTIEDDDPCCPVHGCFSSPRPLGFRPLCICSPTTEGASPLCPLHGDMRK